MPVFVFLVFLAAFVVWLLLSAIYGKLGKFTSSILGDAKDAMTEEDSDDRDDKGSFTEDHESS